MLVQPMLMRPFCAAHQAGLFYYHPWETYESSVLAADGLLGTVSTSANTNDGKGGAVEGQKRADDGNAADDAQQPRE